MSMVELVQDLDYIEVHITEQWINAHRENAESSVRGWMKVGRQ
jgi:hypothetical protein